MDGPRKIGEVVNLQALSKPANVLPMSSGTGLPVGFDTESLHDFQAVETVLDDRLPVSLKPIWNDRIGRDGFETELSGFEFNGASEAETEQAIAILQAANSPCPPEVSAKAVMALKLRTKARADDQADLEARVALMIDDLADYPADVVIDGCRAWAKQNTWFPSWKELTDYLDFRVKKRRKMLEALQGMKACA